MIWLKICGVTRREDAEAAAAAGASAIGFVFWNRSPRVVGAAEARAIGDALPPRVERAGVFVDACREEILRVAEVARLTWIQLHGDEEPEFARALGVPWIKAVRVRSAADVAVAEGWAREGYGGRVLLDAWRAGIPGGTGSAFDWTLAAPLAAGPARVVVAGGIEPGNAARAVRLSGACGVDVSGGVESAPGVKDPARIRALADALRELAPGREERP